MINRVAKTDKQFIENRAKNHRITVRVAKRKKLANKLIRNIANVDDDKEINMKTLVWDTKIKKDSIKNIMQSDEFQTYLANAGLDKCEAAEMLVNKLKQHYELPAGKDKQFKDLMDMVLKSMGAYTTKQEITLDKTPESLTLVRDLIKNDTDSYELPEEDNTTE